MKHLIVAFIFSFFSVASYGADTKIDKMTHHCISNTEEGDLVFALDTTSKRIWVIESSEAPSNGDYAAELEDVIMDIGKTTILFSGNWMVPFDGIAFAVGLKGIIERNSDKYEGTLTSTVLGDKQVDPLICQKI